MSTPLNATTEPGPSGRDLTRIADLSAIGLDREFLIRLAEMVAATPEQPLTRFQAQTLSHPAVQALDGNLLLAGPTSAGKTLIASVLTALARTRQPDRKVVYVVPLRALVTEKANEWQRLFCGARVLPISSDYPRSDHFLRNGDWDIAIVVFEKLYQWLGEADLAKRIVPKLCLVVLDELQVIGEGGRGEKLEVAATLLRHYQKRHERGSTRPFRIVGLGASHEVAAGLRDWLEAEVIPAHPVARPVRLFEAIIRKRPRSWSLRDEASRHPMSPADVPPAISALLQGSPGYPLLVERAVGLGLRVLIYSASRLAAVATARTLARRLPLGSISSSVLEELDQLEDSPIVDELKVLLPARIGVHHGHMSALERSVVERGFRSLDSDRPIKVLVATRTLSMGVNLPADVVIVNDVHTGMGIDGMLGNPHVRKLTVAEYRNLAGRAGRLRPGLPEAAFGLVVVYDKRGVWEGVAQELLEGDTEAVPSALSTPEFGWGPHVVTALAFHESFQRSRTVNERIDAVLHDSYLRSTGASTAEEPAKDISALETLGILTTDGLTGAGNSISKFGLSTEAIGKLIAIAKHFGLWWPHRRLALLDQLFDTPELRHFLRPPSVVGPERTTVARIRAREVSSYAARYLDLDELIPGSPVSDWLVKGSVQPGEVDVARLTKAIALRQWSEGVPHRPLTEFATQRLATQLGFDGYSKRRQRAAFFYMSLGQLSDAAEMTTALLGALRQLCEQLNADRDPEEVSPVMRHFWIWEQSIRHGVPADRVAIPIIVSYGTNVRLRRKTINDLFETMGQAKDFRIWRGRPAPAGIEPHVWELVQAGLHWWRDDAADWNTGERRLGLVLKALEDVVAVRAEASAAIYTATSAGEAPIPEDKASAASSLRPRTLETLERDAQKRIDGWRNQRGVLLSAVSQAIKSAPLKGNVKATAHRKDQRQPLWLVYFGDQLVPIAVWTGDLTQADLNRPAIGSKVGGGVPPGGPGVLIVGGTISPEIVKVPSQFRGIIRAASFLALCRWVQHRPADLSVARSMLIRPSKILRHASEAF